MCCQYDSRRDELTANLLRLYAASTQADRDAGLLWYLRARRIVGAWASYYGHTPATVACVVAACSPQCDWRENLRAAHMVLAGRNDATRALPSCLRKAERILRDRATDTLAYFPQGPKVYAFGQNLAGIDNVVTVDTHAAQAALLNPTLAVRLPWIPYGIFAACYVDAAYRANVAPCDLQAIVWHTWKRLFPAAHKRSLLRSRQIAR